MNENLKKRSRTIPGNPTNLWTLIKPSNVTSVIVEVDFRDDFRLKVDLINFKLKP